MPLFTTAVERHAGGVRHGLALQRLSAQSLCDMDSTLAHKECYDYMLYKLTSYLQLTYQHEVTILIFLADWPA